MDKHTASYKAQAAAFAEHRAAKLAAPLPAYMIGAPAAPVGTVGPRRAAEPTDADLLAALKASPDFTVLAF